MSGGRQLLDRISIDYRNLDTQDTHTIYIDVFDNSLSRKWLIALDELIKKEYHLEKNYCFLGFADSDRSARYLCDRINDSITAINSADIGYQIDDHFTVENTIVPGPIVDASKAGGVEREKFNNLHRYFEDLQGVSGRMSPFYERADPTTRWHIRQLNLLCHEYESLILSLRKKITAPMWQRPSQLMCWLHAPRFVLEESDYELFGIETINRPLGGVFVGVNKAVGKHHWEVFCDEGRDSRLDELVTTVLKNQTEAAGDFDIEWANNPGTFPWQQKNLREFREWLIANNFDPEDKSLSIGHPQVGQVDLIASFGTDDYKDIWKILSSHLDVYRISTSTSTTTYGYSWQDADYIQQQVSIISKGN